MIQLLFLGEIATALYIGGIAQAASSSGISYVLFPELAALAYEVFTHPKGAWAKALPQLILTPALAAVAGSLIAQHLDYGVLSVLLSVVSALMIIHLLDSQVVPAISAALLPVTLGERSWWYPASVLFGTGLLVILLLLYSKYASAQAGKSSEESCKPDKASCVPAKSYMGLLFLGIFLLITLGVVQITNVRFILYPPLVVMAFEMFAHPERCSWRDRLLILPFACALMAFSGWIIHEAFGSGPGAAILVVALGTGVCKLLRLHLPPVMAVGLLPLVIRGSGFEFPLAVAGGTLILAATFGVYRLLTARLSR